MYDLYHVSVKDEYREDICLIASFINKEDAISMKEFLNDNISKGIYRWYEVHRRKEIGE